MRTKITAFHRDNNEVLVGFLEGKLSTDGDFIFLERLEWKNMLIKYFTMSIPDNSDFGRIQHANEK